MIRVGLTGGIGSGKSTVARLLEAHGAVVIDADRIAREVVEPGQPALAEITQRFGDGVLRPDGALDRTALAGIVFGDPDSLAALNAITHPRIGRRIVELGEQAARAGARVLVQDTPLLVELGQAGQFDVVLAVTAPVEVRLDRVVARGLDREDARARMAAQATDEQRAAVADIVLDNSGDEAALAVQVDAVWSGLIGRA